MIDQGRGQDGDGKPCGQRCPRIASDARRPPTATPIKARGVERWRLPAAAGFSETGVDPVSTEGISVFGSVSGSLGAIKAGLKRTTGSGIVPPPSVWRYALAG